MEWLGWSLFFIATAMLIVESWAARRWRRIAYEWRADSYEWESQFDALAVELAVAKRDKELS